MIGAANGLTVWVATRAFRDDSQRLEAWLQSMLVAVGFAWLVQEPAIMAGRAALGRLRSPAYQARRRPC